MTPWKTWTLRALVGAGLALSGCDRMPWPVDGEQATGGAEDPRPVDGPTYSVRLMGVNNAPGYRAVLLTVDGMQVLADGKRMPVQLKAKRVNLADPENAFLVGTFQAPPGAEMLRVSMRLDPAGGYERPGSAGEIDAAGVPIVFETPFANLVDRRHAVIQVDLEKSLFPNPTLRGGRVLLPNTVIAY